MEVSLCGPHSLETSTFAPAVKDVVAPGAGSEPNLARYWYLSHQVGLSGLLDCADTAAARPSVRLARIGSLFVMKPPRSKSGRRGAFYGPPSIPRSSRFATRVSSTVTAAVAARPTASSAHSQGLRCPPCPIVRPAAPR